LSILQETRGSSAGTPEKLFEGRYYTGSGAQVSRQYDVSADGKRFLMVKDASDQTSASWDLVVVQHFDELLKRLVPAK
jgi:hypothetical protein